MFVVIGKVCVRGSLTHEGELGLLERQSVLLFRVPVCISAEEPVVLGNLEETSGRQIALKTEEKTFKIMTSSAGGGRSAAESTSAEDGGVSAAQMR